MERLLDLPTGMLVFELLPLLSTTELGRLDVSVTNKRLRPQLFEVYLSLRLKHSKRNITRNQMEWFFKRSIALTRIRFSGQVSAADISLIFDMLQTAERPSSSGRWTCLSATAITKLLIFRKLYNIALVWSLLL